MPLEYLQQYSTPTAIAHNLTNAEGKRIGQVR